MSEKAGLIETSFADGFAIANGAADADEGQSIAPHARFCEPGEAHLQNPGRFLRREESSDCGCRFLRRCT